MTSRVPAIQSYLKFCYHTYYVYNHMLFALITFSVSKT